MTTGVYSITCRVNGKRYIGSSVNIQSRWGAHRRLLTTGRHWNKHLQNAWNKHGAASFVFEIVEATEPSARVDRELFWANEFKAEYNQSVPDVTKGAFTPSENTRRRVAETNSEQPRWLGKHHSEETKLKVSKSKMGTASWNKGKHLSEEHRLNLSIAHKGQTPTDETLLKRSKALKGRASPMKGKRHSAETLLKMSEAHKRRNQQKMQAAIMAAGLVLP